MRRLIDANALFHEKKLIVVKEGAYDTVRFIFDEINNAPTIDAVEVVRCKDCEWRGKPGCAVRIVDESDKPKDDDFCSWGERREDENK